jgi:hypothetical protein
MTLVRYVSEEHAASIFRGRMFVWSVGIYCLPNYTLSESRRPHCESLPLKSLSIHPVTSRFVSAVGIATGYGLDGRGFGVRVLVGAGFLFSPRHPDRFWGPPNLLSNGYRGLFLRGKAAGAWRLPQHLVPRSRICGSIHPLPHTHSYVLWRFYTKKIYKPSVLHTDIEMLLHLVYD